jgi:hypothetical protein
MRRPASATGGSRSGRRRRCRRCAAPRRRAWPACPRTGRAARHAARWRFRPPAGSGLRGAGGAGRHGHAGRAGAADLVARRRHAHDFYRPMQVARLRATLDAAGQPIALQVKSAGDAISPRWMERGCPRWPARWTAGQDGVGRPVRPALRIREPAHRARVRPHRACRWASGARSAIRTTPSSPNPSSTRLRRLSATRWNCAAAC